MHFLCILMRVVPSTAMHHNSSSWLMKGVSCTFCNAHFFKLFSRCVDSSQLFQSAFCTSRIPKASVRAEPSILPPEMPNWVPIWQAFPSCKLQKPAWEKSHQPFPLKCQTEISIWQTSPSCRSQHGRRAIKPCPPNAAHPSSLWTSTRAHSSSKGVSDSIPSVLFCACAHSCSKGVSESISSISSVRKLTAVKVCLCLLFKSSVRVLTAAAKVCLSLCLLCVHACI